MAPLLGCSISRTSPPKAPESRQLVMMSTLASVEPSSTITSSVSACVVLAANRSRTVPRTRSLL
jgi:hypothetical protein